MKNSSKFFQNNECEYFPCHKVNNEEELKSGEQRPEEGFNCLFCYCPLYQLEHCIGNVKWINVDGKRIKDCSDCVVPHKPENYDKIMAFLMK